VARAADDDALAEFDRQLEHRDVVELEIERIGALRNRLVPAHG
jgi:2-keto-4-pentenoate hydratase/2-oxohepta-3-ene-1,7-dioic acid hydratase in catechol pathway